MAGSPLADAIGVGGSFEVVGVFGLGEPSGLAMALAGRPAEGFGTEELAAAIARVRSEGIVAMETLGEREAIRHRGEEDAAAGREWRTETMGEDRRKKT